jgi:triosephosphate isomerase
MGYLYVANWKIYHHLRSTEYFLETYYLPLRQLIQRSNLTFVLCPPIITLPIIRKELKGLPIILGGQTCSKFKQGAYTGEISAQSLAEVGCQYCLIGHSERRILFGETNEDIVEKMMRLYEQKIEPILCVGETLEEYKDNQIESVLRRQLEPNFDVMQESSGGIVYIAYEPVWAIGSGRIPTVEYLEMAAVYIRKIIRQKMPYFKIRVLYGGSVKPENIERIKKIGVFDGFLIGGASLDMQLLEKIVI